MHSEGLKLLTSLAGITPLGDVLSDLPLPTHVSTLVERRILGEVCENTNESRRLLESTDPTLCSKIQQALSSVENNYIALKKPCVPYVPKAADPPLIRTVYGSSLPKLVIKVARLDPGLYQTPPKEQSPLNSIRASRDKEDVELKKTDTRRNLKRPIEDEPLKESLKRRRFSSEFPSQFGEKSLVVSMNKKFFKGSVESRSVSSKKRFVDGKTGLVVSVPRKKLDSSQDKTFNSTQSAIHKRKKSKLRGGDLARFHFLNQFSVMLDSIFECEEDEMSHYQVSQLLTEVTKLQQQKVLHEITSSSLVRLIKVVEKLVMSGAEISLDNLPDETECDPLTWRKLKKDAILRSLDASLVILKICTAPNIPKVVLLEESFELIISTTNFHLENNIYPQFDPIYKSSKKESGIRYQKPKRKQASHTANKDILAIYHKVIEVIEHLALLLETHLLTDTAVLRVSSLGVSSFFVENINALQLAALRLVRAVFSRYEKHRDLILEDIFSSLARLPTSKKNLRTYRLSNGQAIQMVTALILQLVQCIVVSLLSDFSQEKDREDMEMKVISSYELSLNVGQKFLSTFLKKCCTAKDEDDFRPLFDNFVTDLLCALNLPEWPASEVLLSSLGVLLVHTFGNRSNEMLLRQTAIEHLGTVAAHIRKDAVASTDHDELVNILAEVLQNKLEKPLPSPTETTRLDAFSENSQHLQKALMSYLQKRSEVDPSCIYAHDFYIGQWLRDVQLEMDVAMKVDTSALESPILENEPPAQSVSAIQVVEMKKEKLYSFLNEVQKCPRSLDKLLDERSAVVVTRFLASSRSLYKGFDMYLQQLLRVLNEPAVHVRSRAMKALSSIVAADPSLLSRPDLQHGVHSRFLDHSTLVRETAVDLVGRFVLVCPQLTPQYIEMLGERILDAGVSVRKRVIKILKDICLLQPDFPKNSEICVKILKRINDGEGVKQLVTNVFYQLWFTAPDTKALLIKRAKNLTVVVGACKESESFEQLLQELFKSEDNNTRKTVLEVSHMLVDTLVENVLTLDESAASDQSSSSVDLVSCITTLHLFCKIKPQLLLKHATTLHPYLSSKCSTQNDLLVLCNVAHVLEEVVPMMDHPSESFIKGLEEDLIKLIMSHGQMIVQSCVGCLGAVVNNVTHNYSLVKEIFHRFLSCLEKVKAVHSQSSKNPQLVQTRPSVMRSLFTIGLLCRHFDLKCLSIQDSKPLNSTVYSLMVYFSSYNDEEVQLKAAIGLGFFCIRYPEFMLEEEARSLYQQWLSEECSVVKKCQVLKNLQNHLKMVEVKLKVADSDNLSEDKENLTEFGDLQSSVCSSIAQAFLFPILDSFFHMDVAVRQSSLNVTLLILQQGLVHPSQCIPSLIAMSTDSENSIKVKAEQQLSDHCSRYGHFMQSHLMAGVKKSFEFQVLTNDVARGYSECQSAFQSLLGHVYNLVKSNKQNRRAFLKSLLRHFDEYEKNSLAYLLYLADNLAYFPYNTYEEPLFVIHHIDMTVSVVGSNLLHSLKEALCIKSNEDESEESIATKNYDVSHVSNCCRSSYGFFAISSLKQHLMKSFGLSTSKCQDYTPNESNKAYDRTISKKIDVAFDPPLDLKTIQHETPHDITHCLKQYLEFKSLMSSLDPTDHDDEMSDGEVPGVLCENKLDKSSTKNPVMSRRSSRVSSVSSTGSATSKRPSRAKRKILSSSDESEIEERANV